MAGCRARRPVRKTVATLLEDAGCPEGVAADLLGHDKPTITYGLYSGGSSMATRREWLENAVHYDLVDCDPGALSAAGVA
jgi:hypothetical protein